ncbi:MAG: hypothetical protein ACXAEX_19595 [Promethearchaeota archaeon]|jgi:hypothetical protein
MTKKIAVGFDYTHNNKLTIENNAFTDFVQYLFDSGFQLGKIEAGINSEKLSSYDLFVIGVPHIGPDIDSDEIEVLVDYVLTKNFGITFNPDRLFDNKDFSKDNSHPIIKNFGHHFITRDLNQFIHSNGCTISIDKSIEDENIDVNGLAFSSENTSWHTFFTGDAWQDESKQQLPIIGVTHYKLGKVVAIGNLSIFSSLNESYGIKAADNFKLIANIISWLLNKVGTKEEQALKPIYSTVAITQDLFYWIKDMINLGKWKNIEEVINFAIRMLKVRMKEADKIDQDE